MSSPKKDESDPDQGPRSPSGYLPPITQPLSTVPSDIQPAITVGREERSGSTGSPLAKRRWKAIAKAMEPVAAKTEAKDEQAAAPDVLQPEVKIVPEEEGTQKKKVRSLKKMNIFGKKTAEEPEEDGTVGTDFGKKLKVLKFIARLNIATRKDSSTSVQRSASQRMKDEYAEPQARRRFLFDDVALRGGNVNDLFAENQPPEEDFNDVVDQDDRRIEVFVSTELVGKLLDGVHFKFFIFGLIIINSALIGLQTDYNLSVEYRYLFSIFDHAVLAIFICEILLKWYYGFWIFWQVGWNILDFIIIVALLLGPQLSFLSSSRILRILRVLRAFRSLRSISALAGLSMVVQTILQSIPDMANIVLLLTIIMLMLGVAGVTLFGKNIPSKFGDLQSAMFSLFVCVTQDGWVNIYRNFQKEGGILHVGGAIYFMVAIVLGAFVFANLVVAVVVTNLELAMKELRLEKSQQMDTMATEVEEDLDDPILENPEKVPIEPFTQIEGELNFQEQTPLELVDLSKVTLDKLEKYFLLITALEENMAEYKEIKGDLVQMYDVIRGLNIMEHTRSMEDLATRAERVKSGHSRSAFNVQDLKKGDILSNLIKLEEQQRLTSDVNTLGEMVDSAKANIQNLMRPSGTNLKKSSSKSKTDEASGKKGRRFSLFPNLRKSSKKD